MPIYVREAQSITPPLTEELSSGDENQFLQDPEKLFDKLPQPFRCVSFNIPKDNLKVYYSFIKGINFIFYLYLQSNFCRMLVLVLMAPFSVICLDKFIK